MLFLLTLLLRCSLLLRVLSKPFVKKTATDEFRLLGNISNILACIGQIFSTPGYPTDLQLAASEVCAAC